MADKKDNDQTPDIEPAVVKSEETAEAGAEPTGEASAEQETASADGVNMPTEEAGEMLQLFGALMQKLGRAAEKSEGGAKPGRFGKGVSEVLSNVVDQIREKGADAAQEAQRLADNVVDLEAERRKREQNREPTAFEVKFQSTLKEAFTEYVEDNLVGEENGERIVRVDLDLVKNHGLSLGAHLVRSLADALVPDEYRVNMAADAAEAEDGEEASAESGDDDSAAADAGESGDAGVALEFDLQSFFKRWLTPRATPPEAD